MTTAHETPVEERLGALLDHLGIDRAHFAGREVGELERLCLARPEAVSSLTLVSAYISPRGLTSAEVLRPHADRLLAFFAHSPAPQEGRLRDAISELPGVRVVGFPEGYAVLAWTDIAADQADELAPSMHDSIGEAELSRPATRLTMAVGEGEVAGIRYEVQGEGPALVLFPLSLAPSQWEPLISGLSERYTTIRVSGAYLGAAAVLETRARSEGYRRVVRTMLGEADIRPGERVLEVGCGTGALVRGLAHRTGGANPITALDHSPYLLREATALALAEGLDGAIEFREGDAEALPLADEAYDVTFSSTVMEEVNADRMMAELVRVTCPGGRVAVTVRSVDLPHVFNLSLPDAIRRTLEAPRLGRGVAKGGCADVSLYERFAQSGLTDIRMLPAWNLNSPPSLLWDGWVDVSMQMLTPAERETFQTALREGIEARTAFAGPPFHTAVGTKP